MPQDFSHQNLRGRSFRGQNLEQVNFSGADIRGADFTHALLIGANFGGAKAGLQRRWVVGLVACSWLLAGVSGFSSTVITATAVVVLNPDSMNFIVGIVSLITLAIFFIVVFRKGLVAGTGAGALVLAVAFVVVLTGALAATGGGPGAEALTAAELLTSAGSIAGAGALVLAGAVAGALALALAVALAIAVAGTGAIAGAIAGAIVVALAVAPHVAIAGAIAGALLAKAKAIAVALALALVLASAYIGWLGWAGDKKYALVRSFAVAIAATGGTSFRGADLTDANFTSARLKSTDFRKAILARTCWYKVKMLDRVRPGTTYLQNTQLCQVLVTGLGQDKNFDRQDLRGVNFQQAHLADASFIGADLSGANLQDADLSRAKLVQAQLDETDLTGATLTGACIEDWGITSHTKLDGVRCEYVFMRQPTQEDPNPRRKPDNWEEKFEDGDFADFIKPIVDTLDLYHNQGIDPRAIAISFKQLAENHPDAELRVVGMEVRGENKFLLRAKTVPDADKSQLSAEYFSTYNQIKNLPEQDIKLLLAEKDKHILRLENMVITALERPSFYSNVEQVGFMSNNPGGISQSNTGSMSGGMQASQGDNNQQIIKTNVAASDEKQLTQQEVIQMLAQIEELVRGNAELPEADKEKSLRYLGAAKEEAQATEPDKQLAAGNLKRGVDTLKTASEAVASGKTLWENVKPILVQLPGWLGVAKSFFGF